MKVNLKDSSGIINQSSHPHITNGEGAFNLGQIIAKNGPNYVIVNYPADNDETSFSVADRGLIVARAPCRSLNEPSYMHSFSITKSYFILVEQPLCVRLNSVIWSMLTGKPIVQALKWRSKLAVIVSLNCIKKILFLII